MRSQRRAQLASPSTQPDEHSQHPDQSTINYKLTKLTRNLTCVQSVLQSSFSEIRFVLVLLDLNR